VWYGQLLGQFYAGGHNAGDLWVELVHNHGLVEEHVIFGGEDKLRKLIEASTEVMEVMLLQ